MRIGWQQIVVVIRIEMKDERQLFEVVKANRSMRLGFGVAQSREKETRQDSYDPNHHQQFDQSKSIPFGRFSTSPLAEVCGNPFMVRLRC
jgi:hypothetical protein